MVPPQGQVDRGGLNRRSDFAQIASDPSRNFNGMSILAGCSGQLPVERVDFLGAEVADEERGLIGAEAGP